MLLALLVALALLVRPRAKAVITALLPLPLLPTRKLMLGPNSMNRLEWHMKLVRRMEITLPQRSKAVGMDSSDWGKYGLD